MTRWGWVLTPLLLLAFALLLFRLSSGAVPERTRAVTTPRPPEPGRVIRLRPPSLPRPGPSPELTDTPSTVSRPLSPASRADMVAATNTATGDGWDACITPWLEDLPPATEPRPPLVLFFDLVDGRLSEVRLRSTLDLPPAVTDCFAERVWEHPFPEDEAHRGRTTLQRVMPIPP